ncbi:MAG: polysaccharide biosynthesis tyrosine autokinase [Proteobacteria bacterium]|nr:polysaccharide biosynthesis tyrosine autokinase [Pseudomonadota bacterium]
MNASATPTPPARESHEPVSAQAIFPIREYIAIVLHRRWGFLLAFTLVACLGVLYTLHQPKIYEAVTAVIINPEPPTINPLESSESQQWFLRDTYYDTQLRVMQSRYVAGRVIDDLGLADDLVFLNLHDIKDPDILKKRRDSIDPIAVLLAGLRIEAVLGTRLVNIRVRHSNPELAATIANAIATAYSEQNSEHRLESLNNTFEFIDKQFKDNEIKLQAARDDLNTFKENHQILYSNPIEQQKITNQRLDYLHNKRVEIETQRQHAGYILAELRAITVDVKNVQAFGALLETNALENLMATCRLLQQDLQKQLITYHDKSPQVTSLREQIKSCENNVLANMRSQVQGQTARHQALVKLNKELNDEIKALQGEALKLDQLRLLYEQFESQKAEQERLFEQSQKKLNEVSLNRLLEINNIRTLDTAIVSKTPVSPNLLINGAITLLAAFIAGALLVLVLELLDISVRTQQDVEQRALLPFLGAVPKYPRSNRFAGRNAYRFIIENPQSPIAECVRTLRTTLSFLLPRDRSQVLLITSAQPLEGKTMTSISLAVTSALAGQKVILIEADLRRPRIYKALGSKGKGGLTAVISQEQKLEEALYHTEVKGLDLLPCGAIPSNPAELFHTKEFAALIDILQKKYDRIIIDSPPVTVVTDALIMARYVHGVIIIARADKTPIPMLVRTRELLEGIQAPIMGVVLNDMPAHSRGYGGYYYYSKSYRDGE